MKISRLIFIFALVFGLYQKAFTVETRGLIGVVNFMTCITDSKYGKSEQEQLENIKKQWTTLIEESEKELNNISTKFDDQDYIDGLSPEAEEELRLKHKALSEDIMKYQNQLYQILNQAQYFFVQKISNNISKASEKVAVDRKLNLVLNKEMTFYTDPKLDITTLVISEMDKDYEKETVKNEEQVTKELQQTKELSDNSKKQ